MFPSVSFDIYVTFLILLFCNNVHNVTSLEDEDLVLDDLNLQQKTISMREGKADQDGDNDDDTNAEDLLNEIIRYGIDQSDFLSDVQEPNLYKQGISLKKSDPAHFVAIFNKQKKRSLELSRYAYASLEASDLLARQ